VRADFSAHYSCNTEKDHIDMSTAEILSEYADLPKACAEALSAIAYRHHPFANFYYSTDITLAVILAGHPLGQLVRTACATTTHIYLNDAFFRRLTIQERVGVVLHEIAHQMMGHPSMGMYWHQLGHVPNIDNSRNLPYDHEQMNIAMDAVINLWLTDATVILPQNRVSFPWVTPEHSVLEVYERLIDEKAAKGDPDKGDPDKGAPDKGAPDKGDPAEGGEAGDEDGDGTPEDGQGQLPCGGTVLPGKAGRGDHALAAKAESAADKLAREQAVEGSLNAGKAAGTLPGNMKRSLEKMLTPKVRWQDELKELIVACKGNDRLNYSRMNRRRFLLTTEVMPLRRSERIGTIYFLFDTSGSVQSYIPQFMGEVAGVVQELQPREVVVLWVDTKVHVVDVLMDAEQADVRKLAVHGGGGTDLRTGFAYADANGEGHPARADALEPHDPCTAMIVLTDSETPWPAYRPEYPVICATTEPGHKHPDWMRVVSLK